MAIEVLMPKLGLTMTEGTIEEWMKQEGDQVKKGDVLFSVATDKLVNEVEAAQILGCSVTNGVAAARALREKLPRAAIVLTLGGEGAVYADGDCIFAQSAVPVRAVDTTAAGDTFTGYFLAGLMAGMPMQDVLKMSAKASSIAVSRAGAVPSIPYRAEVSINS